MALYAVYKLAADGDFLTLELQESWGALQINQTLATKHNIANGSLNWYGADGNTPEEAVRVAVQGGYKFIPAEEMLSLHAQLNEQPAHQPYAPFDLSADFLTSRHPLRHNVRYPGTVIPCGKKDFDPE